MTAEPEMAVVGMIVVSCYPARLSAFPIIVAGDARNLASTATVAVAGFAAGLDFGRIQPRLPRLALEAGTPPRACNCRKSQFGQILL
jgi:hypothetical protein